MFDKFSANNLSALELFPTALADGAAELTWDAEGALCWRLESAPDRTTWKATAGDKLREVRAALRIPRDLAGGRKSLYYRFAKGPARR